MSWDSLKNTPKNNFTKVPLSSNLKLFGYITLDILSENTWNRKVSISKNPPFEIKTLY